MSDDEHGPPRVMRSSGGGQTAELPVLITGPGTEPEELMLIGLPSGGKVRVRGWRGDAWASEPTERETTAQELYAEIEGALKKGRRLNQESYAVKRWLGLA